MLFCVFVIVSSTFALPVKSDHKKVVDDDDDLDTAESSIVTTYHAYPTSVEYYPSYPSFPIIAPPPFPFFPIVPPVPFFGPVFPTFGTGYGSGIAVSSSSYY